MYNFEDEGLENFAEDITDSKIGSGSSDHSPISKEKLLLYPRTSTPQPDDTASTEIQQRSQYSTWKHHLKKLPKKLKVRGLTEYCPDVISAHIEMKPSILGATNDVSSETLPLLNNCFLGLAVNSTSSTHCPVQLLYPKNYTTSPPENFINHPFINFDRRKYQSTTDEVVNLMSLYTNRRSNLA